MRYFITKKLRKTLIILTVILIMPVFIKEFFDIASVNVYAKSVQTQDNIKNEDNSISSDDVGSTLGQYDFKKIDTSLDETLNVDIDFKELVTNIINGGNNGIKGNTLSQLKNMLVKELAGNKVAIVQVIILAVISAVFTNFASVFNNSQISDTGFLVTVMALITILLSAFTLASSLAQNTIGAVNNFMKTLIPIYFSCVAMSSGSVSTIAYYQIVLCVIALVNWVFLNIVVKGSYIYVVLSMANSITKEDNLSKLGDLIKTILNWIAKSSLAIVIGINSIQSLVLPLADSMKTNMLTKSLSMIPGIGNGVSALSSTIIGAGTIVKNGVGAAALVIVVLISLIPIIKLVIFVITYKFIGAMMQPIADKRIVKCIGSVSDGVNILLTAVMYSAIMFLITIAIICASTNVRYFAS